MDTHIKIEDIEMAYLDGCYGYNMAIPDYVYPPHVFDENLSVKRNREMAIEHNKMVDRMKEEQRAKSKELSCKLSNDVVAYIVNTYGMNENQARIVERYVYNREHHFMTGYFSTIDEVATMVESALKA